MEIRRLWLLPLDKSNDELLKVTYLKVLSLEKYESIKLPTNFENYKYQDLLDISKLLYVELVRTRKNWILKSVLEYKALLKLSSYQDFLKLAEVKGLLLSFFQEEHEAKVLEYLIFLFKTENISDIKLNDFNHKLLQLQGFA